MNAAGQRSQSFGRHFGELRLFSQWSNGEGPLIDTAVPASFDLLQDVRGPAHWWVVTATATEVIRPSDGPLRPLSREAILRDGVPSSRLRLRVSWYGGGAGNAIDVDLGSGVRLSVGGPIVDVRVLAPAHRSREVASDDQPELGDGGVYLDTIAWAHVVPSAAPVPSTSLTLTQAFPGDVPTTIRVPAFARRLHGFGDIEEAAFTVGELGLSLAHLPIGHGHFEGLIPQQASHLHVAAEDLTLVWGLEL